MRFHFGRALFLHRFRGEIIVLCNQNTGFSLSQKCVSGHQNRPQTRHRPQNRSQNRPQNQPQNRSQNSYQNI